MTRNHSSTNVCLAIRQTQLIKALALLLFLALGISTLLINSRSVSLPFAQCPQQPGKQEDIYPLRNISIVLMGDSITRYQYLSLIYFLRWGTWFDPRKVSPHLVKEGSFWSPLHAEYWMEFYLQTNRMVAPFESCDCYRPVAEEILEQLPLICENRYFYDKENNVSVTYIQAFGHSSTPHGHLNASTALLTASPSILKFKSTNFTWSYKNWHEAVSFHIAELRPKPQFVVMNAGLWPNIFFNYSQTRKKLADAFQFTGMKGIWKTTTYRINGDPAPYSAGDSLMCEELGACLNLSWTAQLSPDMYWDRNHFYEPVYRQINEQMLGMMFHR
jgi:hypothetical protein